MDKRLAMLRLDFFSIREYLAPKYLLIFFGFLLLFSLVMDSPVSAIGMFMIYGMFYTAYPFAIAEKTQLDLLYASLPLRQKDLISGRYLFALCVNLTTGLVSFAVCAALSYFDEAPFDLRAALITVAVCFYLYSLIEFFQFPLFFKFGYQKARLAAMLPIAGLAAVAATLSHVSGGTPSWVADAVQWVSRHPSLPVLTLLLLWLLLLWASLYLSGRFYARREF